MVKTEQVVFITGASRGFGAATARELALRGHSVIATMRNPDRDGAAVRDGYENQITVTACDVTNRDSVDAAVAVALEQHGHIDALFNNAGYGLYGAIEDLSEEAILRILDTNLVGQIRTSQAILPSMRARGSGKIINVSSNSGKLVSPLGGMYSASKHAVEAMSEALRYEVKQFGIEVTALEPGMYVSDWQYGSLDLDTNLTGGVYAEATKRTLELFRERAETRPGSRTIGSNVADIVELEQPLPMRWPVGEDTLELFALRESLTDSQWEDWIQGNAGDSTSTRGHYFRVLAEQAK
jgi:NAD(P)-dependent dehydrogenase (short-subunit alcohol dehydrogenase family)